MKRGNNVTTPLITTRARQMLVFVFFFFKVKVNLFKSEAPRHNLISLTAQRSLSLYDELYLSLLPKSCSGKSCFIHECGSFTNDGKSCFSKHNRFWVELPGPTESDLLQSILEIWACTCPSPSLHLLPMFGFLQDKLSTTSPHNCTDPGLQGVCWRRFS